MPSPVVIIGVLALMILGFWIRFRRRLAAWRRRERSEGARLKAFLAMDPGREKQATDPDREG